MYTLLYIQVVHEYRNMERLWHDVHKPNICMPVTVVTMQQTIAAVVSTYET